MMKQTASLLVFALVFTLSPDIASGAKKLCKDSLNFKWTTNDSPKYLRKAHGEWEWKMRAEAKYGKAYGGWGLAIKRKFSCKKINLRVTMPGENPSPKFKCTIKAKPCIIETPKKTCHAVETGNLYSYGKGEGRTKKKAKALARASWKKKVTASYGIDFSDWNLAKGRHNRCIWKACDAKARPCNLK